MLSVAFLTQFLIALNVAEIGNSCYGYGESCSEQENSLNTIPITEIGEVQTKTISGNEYSIKLISIQPLIFEIPNYLSNEECDALISEALKQGMQPARTHQGRDSHGRTRKVNVFDIDKSGDLDFDEMRITLEQMHDVNMNNQDLVMMYRSLNMDRDSNGRISRSELQSVKAKELSAYLKEYLLVDQPWKHSRLSDIVWLYSHMYMPVHNGPSAGNADIIVDIYQRLYELLDLPSFVIDNSDAMQILHYGHRGKYNAHFDTMPMATERKVQCCFLMDPQARQFNPCASCRFATVFYYLNDVAVGDGGETVFPLIREDYLRQHFNQTKDKTEPGFFDEIEWRMSEQNLPEFYCDPEVDNLKIRPEKGKAIVWYNSQIDKQSDWLGGLDIYSLHSACELKHGEKWAANHWIRVSDNRQDDKKHAKSLHSGLKNM